MFSEKNAVDFFQHQESGIFWTELKQELIQETRMLSQAINRAMLHSRNQLEEGVSRKELNILFACSIGSKHTSAETR